MHALVFYILFGFVPPQIWSSSPLLFAKHNCGNSPKV